MKPTHLPKRCISTIPPSQIHQPRPPLPSTMVPLRNPRRQSRLPPTAISSPAISMRALFASRSNKPPPSPANPGSAKTHDQEQMAEEVQAPSVSFEGLGISRNMKVVLLFILGVFGSVETYFWCRAIWTWWMGGEEEGDGQE